MMPGTPIIYQGDEIGMTNTYFDRIEDYNDRYTVGDYRERINAGMTHEEALYPIRMASRDNARTPMLWNGSENAGFTHGTPWIKVNSNYRNINASLDRSKPDGKSVFRFYQKLISMRKEHPAVLSGDFKMYLPDDEHFVIFLRTDKDSREKLLVIANASAEAARLPEIPELEEFYGDTETLISTTDKSFGKLNDKAFFMPWEAYVLKR